MRKLIGVFAILFIIIVPHELGHFAAAKLSGVSVLRFSLGFGPVAASAWIGETEVCLSLIPFGGYVMLNEPGAVLWWSSEEQKELQQKHPKAWLALIDPRRTISSKPPAVQFLVSTAGAAVNFLFAVLSMPFLFRLAEQGRLRVESFYLGESSSKGFIGPIGIIKMTAAAGEQGLAAAWLLSVRFAVGVGLLQLMPLPFLDGLKALRALLMALGQTGLSRIFAILLILSAGFALYNLYSQARKSLIRLRAMVSAQNPTFLDAMRQMLDLIRHR